VTKGLLLSLLIASTAETCGAVGYREAAWTYQTVAGADRTIRVALWYPSSGPQVVRNYGVISGSVVSDGPLPTAVPAIIALSHGYLGCGAAMSYVAQSLASYGYAVIAPDHDDTGMCKIGEGKLPLPPQGSVPAAWETRPPDLRAAIDAMQSYGVTSDVIIAAGHSFGGWTALAIDGVVPTQHDPRVDGVIAMAPNSDAAAVATYHAARPPILYLGAGIDGDLRPAYTATQAPKYLDILPTANHFTFSDTGCAIYGSVENCLRSNANARKVVEMCLALIRLVRGDAQGRTTLHTSDYWQE
jgi:predicted dienelactone hydrolase